MWEYVPLVAGAAAMVSIIGFYDSVTPKGKKTMRRVLAVCATIFLVSCVIGSRFETANSATLSSSYEVLSATDL